MSDKLTLVHKGDRKEYTYHPDHYPGWTVVEENISPNDPRLKDDAEAKAVAEIAALGSVGRFQKLEAEIKDLKARLEKNNAS